MAINQLQIINEGLKNKKRKTEIDYIRKNQKKYK